MSTTQHWCPVSTQYNMGSSMIQSRLCCLSTTTTTQNTAVCNSSSRNRVWHYEDSDANIGVRCSQCAHHPLSWHLIPLDKVPNFAIICHPLSTNTFKKHHSFWPAVPFSLKLIKYVWFVFDWSHYLCGYGTLQTLRRHKSIYWSLKLNESILTVMCQ